MADKWQTQKIEQFFRDITVSEIILTNLTFSYKEESKHFFMLKGMTVKSGRLNTVGQELR